MNSKKQDRLDKIKSKIISEAGISIKDLASFLNVSEITIRRDLKYLEEEGIIRLINGVAIYKAKENASSYPEYNLEDAKSVFQSKKDKIAMRAASLIEKNDVVAIDSGSTTSYISKHIKEDMHITVLTSSLNVLMDIGRNTNIDIICSGGYLYKNTRLFYSPEGISMINRTCINKAFISVAGINDKFNVACIAPHEMDAKRAFMESSQTNILLADSSKFGKIFPTAFSHLSNFDIIITDNDLSDEWRKNIADLGIKLYCE